MVHVWLYRAQSNSLPCHPYIYSHRLTLFSHPIGLHKGHVLHVFTVIPLKFLQMRGLSGNNTVCLMLSFNEVAALHLNSRGTRFTGHVGLELTLHSSVCIIMQLCVLPFARPSQLPSLRHVCLLERCHMSQIAHTYTQVRWCIHLFLTCRWLYFSVNRESCRIFQMEAKHSWTDLVWNLKKHYKY